VTAVRYTAVFGGLLSLEKPGEYAYLRMSGDPPVWGYYAVNHGRPPYGELGREISYEDLPEERKAIVLATYRKMWDL
jgi:hypothetical protein